MANQAWQITSPGTISLRDLGNIPKPGPNEVLVRIHAVSVNYRDKLIIDHNPNYPLKAKQDLVPGADGAGVIEEVGAESIWKKGDRVTIQGNGWLSGYDQRSWEFEKTFGGGEVDGTFRRWMVVSDEKVFRSPDGLSDEEACTLFVVGVTAYRALFHGGRRVGPGTTVLTQGTGGVSCYAMQIAAAAGAAVVATSSSDEKLDVARKLGATHLINYRKNEDWAAKVLEVTSGKGVDIVIDVVGAQSFEQTVKCTASGGTICVLGMLGADPFKPVNIVADIMLKALTIVGQLGSGSRQLSEETSAFLEKHRIHPQIAELFEFEEMEKAMEALLKLSAPGNIVVRV